MNFAVVAVVIAEAAEVVAVDLLELPGHFLVLFVVQNLVALQVSNYSQFD